MSVHLFSGSDEVVLRSTVSAAVHELVGDGDRSLMVDEFEGDEYELGDVVAAASTPPFLTDSRVVVARDIGRFTARELKTLVAYLEQPSETTELVLVGGGGRQPKALTDAVKKAGGRTVNTTPPGRPRERQDWLAREASDRELTLRPDAAARIAEHFGEDVGRVQSLFDTLVAMYGAGAVVDRNAIEPYLGEGGDLPPWDLTDAIDRGETSKALSLLSRMMGAGRHSLQIMAILHNHYGRLARLDTAGGIRSETDAAEAMGIKPGFPAKKALQLYRRLGAAPVHRAIDLLATADLDLRGARELPDEVVMEVLVARLSKL